MTGPGNTEEVEEPVVYLRSLQLGGKPIPGYDVLGMAKYCDTYLKAPRLPSVSSLMRTFGDPIPCLRRALARGDLKYVQMNLRDATCWRNRVCPSGTPSLTDWNDIKRLAQQVNKVAVDFPGTEFYISPYLEHDFKDAKTIQKACQVSLAACPTCKCVNEPFSGTKNTGYPLELHGTKVKAWSVSGDGASMFDGDNIKNDGNNFQHRLAGTDFIYAWWNEINLRCTGEKSFTPINKRTARPEGWQFQMASKILTTQEDPIPAVPAQCRTVRHVEARRGEINKVTAERYCNGQVGENDSRGNKPLLIIRKGGKRGDKLKVLRPDGREVGCFAYYGTFTTPGTHRWYMGNCSGENGWQLYKELGQEWGYATLGGGACLRFNAIRREGVYR